MYYLFISYLFQLLAIIISLNIYKYLVKYVCQITLHIDDFQLITLKF